MCKFRMNRVNVNPTAIYSISSTLLMFQMTSTPCQYHLHICTCLYAVALIGVSVSLIVLGSLQVTHDLYVMGIGSSSHVVKHNTTDWVILLFLLFYFWNSFSHYDDSAFQPLMGICISEKSAHAWVVLPWMFGRWGCSEKPSVSRIFLFM